MNLDSEFIPYLSYFVYYTEKVVLILNFETKS